MKKQWRRKNYFIKKDLQGRYIFSFFLFVFLGSLLFAVIFSILSANTLTVVYKDNNLSLGKTPIILFQEMLNAQWLFIVTGGLLIVVVSMFLTHRFAGPLFRFEKSVEEMNKNNFDFEIHLRNKDEGKELARMMNQFLAGISLQLRELRELSGQLGGHLSDASETKTDADAGTALEKALSVNSRMREILASFKLKND